MRRGYHGQAAAVLEGVTQNRTRAPSRILASVGINFSFLVNLEAAGLVRRYKMDKYNRLEVTEKGREFLDAYKICETLLPT
jgi:predicted transcriptional regulator